MRTTTRFDYQPDVCKDYKETGYCGYGDNCIYLHDRGDYLSGWQMEKAWQEKRRNQQERMRKGQCIPAKEDAASKEKDEEYPFACHICRKSFTKPVETVCGHYFCESCALKRYAKRASCAVCGKKTGGIFNTAKGLELAIERREGGDVNTN